MKSEANRSRVARKTGSKPRHTLQDSAHETLTVTDDLGLAQTTLAEGDGELLEAFLGVSNLKPKDIIQAKKIYSKLDIDDFYEWASQHFGLDDYYEDAEDLVDHVKCIFRRDEILLDTNADYQFMVKMIGRSEQILYNQTV